MYIKYFKGCDMALLYELINAHDFLFKVIIRLLLSVLIGVLIGSERAKHGRAAGMRTHTLVALGACLTSLMSVYVSDILGSGGDVMRISAQVISGIGFLGAGMIIIKNNDIITGLTTAAGVWTTSIIGIALGYGFYSGAIIGAVLFLVSIVVFTRFEKRRKSTEHIYVEIDDMYKVNKTVEALKKAFDIEVSYNIVPPKSAYGGNLGIVITIPKRIDIDSKKLCEIDNVIFVCEE